jgi:uncharacterized protein involved in exopolysaccharide biosynthesis/MinD-like ATPase involved in chromosome partitioning or flagellar assembly
MSPQEATLRRETPASLRDAGAAWALPQRAAGDAAAQPATKPADDALLALLKDDVSDAPSFPKRLRPSRLLRGVLLRWRMIALIVAAFAIAGLASALALVDKKWQGVATLIVSDRKAVLSIGGGQPYQTRDYGLETLMDTLKLPTSLDEALRRSGVHATRTQLASAVKVTLAQKSDVVNLRVVWDSPADAAALANHLADVFVERTTRIRTDQAVHDHASFRRQLQDARRRLAAIDAEVLAFQQQNKVASFEEETKARLIDLSKLQSEHWASQGEVEALRLARSDFEAALKAVPETVTSTLFRNPLGKRLEEVEWQLKEARTRYTEENPKVVKLREQADALKGLAEGSEFTGGETSRSPNDLRRDLKVKLQDLVTTLRIAEGREAGLANSIAQMESKIGELASLEKQFRQLEARQTSARDLERSLSSKAEEALAATAGGESSLQLVERASVPSLPEPSARRLLFAASVLLGVLAALCLALLFELVDDRTRCREDLEDLVDEGGACTEIGRVGVAESAVVSLASPAFRSFRRFVNDLCASSPEWTSLAIVSAGSGDGRSTVARATALCMAMRGERTVLVDADLRPEAGARSVTAAGPGLVEAMQGKSTIEDCMQRGAHERLSVIPCSETPPGEDTVLLLGQPEAAQVLATAAARSRRAVLDMPPAGDDEGAFELACLSGRAVIVARYGTTSRTDLSALVARLRARGARIAGAVILDVPSERQHPYAGPSAATAIRGELQRVVQLFRTRKAHA